MNELITRTTQLPDTLEDLTQFVLVGKSKLNAYMLKLRTVNRLTTAQEIRNQTLEETQELANALIAAEQRIGELLLSIPKASGGDRRSEDFKNDSNVNFEKTKSETISDMGYGEREARDYQQMAKNPDIVRKVIEDATAAGEVVTKSTVMRQIQKAKEEARAEAQAEINRLKADNRTLANRSKPETKIVEVEPEIHLQHRHGLSLFPIQHERTPAAGTSQRQMGIGGDTVLSRLRGLAKMNTCKCGKSISYHKTMCIACMWKEAQKRAGGGMKIKPKQTRICGWCGKEFTVNVYNKTYCSNKCANAFKNSQTETRVCIVCGEKFETLSRNTAVRCMDCRSKKAEKKKCTFTPTNDNTPDGPNELDMWMGDRGLVPVRVETGRQKAKATVKIRPEKLRKPLLEPTKQWTGETPEERFWRSAAEAMQKYRMKAPAERKRRDTCPKGRYTETEDAIIVNMRKKGVKIAQIAAATGRSVPAIKQRLSWLAKSATSSNDASSGEEFVPNTGA